MLVDHVYEEFNVNDYRFKTLVNKDTKRFNVKLTKYDDGDLFNIEYEKYLNNPNRIDGSFDSVAGTREAILKFICNEFNNKIKYKSMF